MPACARYMYFTFVFLFETREPTPLQPAHSIARAIDRTLAARDRIVRRVSRPGGARRVTGTHVTYSMCRPLHANDAIRQRAAALFCCMLAAVTVGRGAASSIKTCSAVLQSVCGGRRSQPELANLSNLGGSGGLGHSTWAAC